MMLCRYQIAIKPQISQPPASRWSRFGGMWTKFNAISPPAHSV